MDEIIGAMQRNPTDSEQVRSLEAVLTCLPLPSLPSLLSSHFFSRKTPGHVLLSLVQSNGNAVISLGQRPGLTGSLGLSQGGAFKGSETP